ncbi:MAG: phenylalanine--tRNA ligase subunit beta [Candidatus Saccharimonadales bacterium]|jgi:phenylalanyl-tRNA synthetase beta chain
MKVSVNWIRFINDEYGCAANPMPDGINALVEKIGAQLGAVEEVVNLGKKYDGVLVVKVVACEKHPNADKLTFCLVDDGRANKKVRRNKDGLIEIVCGAPNVKAGQLAVWIPPGVTVPSTYDKEPFVVEPREIRGKTSHGMLASAKELALGDNHEGIVVLENGKPGDSFAKTLWLDDHIIDIENKMFTHRPDCFGMLGVVREIAGINHQAFKSPDWYRENASLPADGRKNVLKITVKNGVPKLVPRFCAVAFKDVRVEPSPAWLQSFLVRVGVRPVNNIVDITNLVMLETAQPLHAYDYDKLLVQQKQETGNKKQEVVIGIRLSKKGEELKLLGGKTIKLDGSAVVITDGNKPIGLGGVMGGAGTEVDESTKNIVLEVANFDMNLTRKTAMAYGLFTDAATRFTKGQSPRQNMAVLAKAAEDIKKIAGGRQASEVVDDFEQQATGNKQKALEASTEFINQRLGLQLSAKEMQKLLTNVEFEVELSGNFLKITPPFWRTDIGIAEDIVEEIGRLQGYDQLPLVLPPRDLSPAALNPVVVFKDRLRNILAAAGANEILTYSFVHDSLLQKVGQDPRQAYQLANALSPNLQYYRLSLTPSLLEKVHPNIKAGFDHFAIYELGRTHIKGVLDNEGLPSEPQRLGIVVTTLQVRPNWGAPYFVARKFTDYLTQNLGIYSLKYVPLAGKNILPPAWTLAAQAFESQRSAVIYSGNLVVGLIGEPTAGLRSSLKLPERTAQLEFDVKVLQELAMVNQYYPLNRYPEVEQDFCLRAPANLSYTELAEFIVKNLTQLTKPHGYEFRWRPIDIFQKAGDKTHKQTTWRITLFHPERTLTTQETNQLLDQLAATAKKELKAERV